MAKKKKQARQEFKRRAKWWYAIWAVLPVLLLLALTEGGLRLAGFGYPTAFFIPAGDGFVESNERFAWRFMSPELARDPLPMRFAKHKPAGTVRIFILGESAAQGIPEPAFGFGRILDVMLRDRYPGRHFEVINTGVTAINSYAVREIAGECMRYEPDLLIVYCGNNEVVGPFGPGTIFQARMPGLGLARLQLCLSRLRIWQGLTKLASVWNPPRQWAGMEMFLNHQVASDDPRLDKVYDHFRANIGDVLDAARRQSVPVVMCTVPVNLEACPPFASQHQHGWSEDDEHKWNGPYAAGTNAEAHSEWAVAEKNYGEAERLDPRYAEVNFRRARCLMALSRAKEGEEEFSAARDHDALRFRADSQLNESIRGLAQAVGANVTLYDAAAEFANDRDDLFYEHVHMRFPGNYLLAQGFLKGIGTALSLGGQGNAGPRPVPQEAECAERLAYTPWSRWKSDKTAVSMVARPPFTLQIDHQTTFAQRLKLLDEEAKTATSPEELVRSTEAYDKVLKERPDDYLLHRNFIELLYQAGDFKRAIAESRAGEEQLPGYAKSKLQLGDVLLNADQLDEAIRVYREVIKERPEMAEARQSLGDALAKNGAADEALAAYQAALVRGGDAPELHNNLATLLVGKGDLKGAAEHLRRALEWTDDPIWHANLGGLLVLQKEYAEAETELNRAISLMPDNAPLRDNLGQALLAEGKTKEAIAQFQMALQLEPGYESARRNLERAQSAP